MDNTPSHLTPLGLWLISIGHGNGIASRAMGKFFGVSGCAIRAAHRNHVRGMRDKRTSASRGRVRRSEGPSPGRSWDESLVEPWAIYSARRKAERAAAKPQGQP